MRKAGLMACAAMAAAVAAGTAVADTPTMDVGAYGGSTENLMKEKIIPAFEARNDVKIVCVPGNSTDTLAKLQAQKSAEELDVVFLDDGPMYQAVALGFCAPIEKAPVLADIYDIARMGTDKAIGVGFVVTGSGPVSPKTR